MATQELIQGLQVCTDNGTTYESIGSAYATYDDLPAAAYDSLFINNFYQATLASVLSPGLYSNSNAFYAPTATKGAVNLAPSLYSNSSSFYVPTVGRGAVTLTPSLYSNSSTFNAHTLTSVYALSPSRYDNTETFYAPTATKVAYPLTPSLYSNSNTFYSGTVGRGPVTLTASRYDNAQTFYTQTVAPGTITLVPSRYDNSSSFYSATVTPGSVNLSPSLVSDGDTFYTHSLANIQPRYARPEADVSQGAWTASTGTDLYAMVDEVSASDTDYIQTTSATVCNLRLQPVNDPGTSTGQVVTVRAKSTLGSTLTVRLKQGTTTIATLTQAGVASSFTDYSLTLSAAEADSITDYTNLRVELEAA